jgi:hypothetical protein
MKIKVGQSKKIEVETESGSLHEVDLYQFSRRPVKSLFEGHGQPVKVSDGGVPIFFALPSGVYYALIEQVANQEDKRQGKHLRGIASHTLEVLKDHKG